MPDDPIEPPAPPPEATQPERPSAARTERSSTLLAVFIVLALLIGVPQVYNVLFQMPGRLFGPDWLPVTLWMLYHVLLFPLGWMMFRVCAPALETERAPALARWRTPGIYAFLWLVFTSIGMVIFLVQNHDPGSTDPAEGVIMRVKVAIPLGLLALGGWFAAQIDWVDKLIGWFQAFGALLAKKIFREGKLSSEFKKRNLNARMVCIDVQPYRTSQAPERDDILHVGGFSDLVFDLVASFAEDGLDSSRWVDVIGAVEI